MLANLVTPFILDWSPDKGIEYMVSYPPYRKLCFSSIELDDLNDEPVKQWSTFPLCILNKCMQFSLRVLQFRLILSLGLLWLLVSFYCRFISQAMLVEAMFNWMQMLELQFRIFLDMQIASNSRSITSCVNSKICSIQAHIFGWHWIKITTVWRFWQKLGMLFFTVCFTMQYFQILKS